MQAGYLLDADIFSHFSHFGLRKPRLLDQAALEQIRKIGIGLVNLDKRFAPIARAIDLYHALGRMGGAVAAWYSSQGATDKTPLYVLGVFAVLESLLTHDPHGGYDSLTHQIKTKMALLDSRFSERLDYSKFGTARADKIWARLYAFRSALAHGQQFDFVRDRVLLKDDRTVVRFLDEATKALLRHALQEPQLITDLRAC